MCHLSLSLFVLWIKRISYVLLCKGKNRDLETNQKQVLLSSVVVLHCTQNHYIHLYGLLLENVLVGENGRERTMDA